MSEAKTHVIDGVTYRETQRKAEVGEKVIVTEKETILGEDRFGEILNVIKLDGELINTDGKWDDGSTLNLTTSEYAVLDPAEPADSTPDLLDLVANLSRRVTELERNVFEPAPEELTFEVGDIVRVDGYVYEVQLALSDGAYFLEGMAEEYWKADLTLVCRAADRLDCEC